MAKRMSLHPPDAPEEIGGRIYERRRWLNISQTDVARHFGISSQAVSQWESGETKPDRSRLSALAKLLTCRLQWLLTGEGPETEFDDEEHPEDIVIDQNTRVPLINNVTAGNWSSVFGQHFDNEEEKIYIATDKVVSNRAFALEIRGTSMEPVFEAGDRVIIDPAIDPRPGDYVVAKLDRDDEATFKKYRLAGYDNGGAPIIELAPLNTDYPVLRMTSDLPGNIVGTMVEHRKYRR